MVVTVRREASAMDTLCGCDQGCQARALNRNIVRCHAFSTADRVGALQRSLDTPDRRDRRGRS
jgi:hypothetical protein